MIRTRQLLSMLAAAVLLLSALAAPAQSASSPGVVASPAQHCVIVLGKAPPGQPSPVRSSSCADDYATAQREAGAASSVLLMEWFWNANNQPPKLTRVLGDYGYCDSAGYRIIVKDDWANNISGFNSYSNCNVVTGFNWPSTVDWSGDEQTWSLQAPCGCVLQGWVGSFMNDRIEAFWIRKG
ncbi:hypothetical protein [Nonomuraea cavernae]|uniref:hypothetical protein n=1 Tax=Nonomuraea cavernae TaxID=2045107 RepID=UPI0033EFE303